mgnify:CR=1 FL=1
MENFMHDVDKYQLGIIGVSNFNIKQLKALINHPEKPHFWPFTVQNRFTARNQWDKEVREFCQSKGIVYQGFSILTANRNVLQTKQIAAMAAKYKLTKQQVLIRFAVQLGISVLIGSSDIVHITEDLMMRDILLIAILLLDTKD